MFESDFHFAKCDFVISLAFHFRFISYGLISTDSLLWFKILFSSNLSIRSHWKKQKTNQRRQISQINNNICYISMFLAINFLFKNKMKRATQLVEERLNGNSSKWNSTLFNKNRTPFFDCFKTQLVLISSRCPFAIMVCHIIYYFYFLDGSFFGNVIVCMGCVLTIRLLKIA